MTMGLLVYAAIKWDLAGVRTPDPILSPVLLGNISYSIYMWHWIAFMFTVTWFAPFMGSDIGFVLFFATETSITLAAAVVSFYVVENPFNRLASQLTHRRKALKTPVGAV